MEEQIGSGEAVQLLSLVRLCYPRDCTTSGLPIFHYLLDLLKLMFTESMMLSGEAEQLLHHWQTTRTIPRK